MLGLGAVIVASIMLTACPMGECVNEYDWALVADTSGSMADPSNGRPKIDWLRDGLHTIVDLSGPNDRLALVSFNAVASLDVPLTNRKRDVDRGIDRLAPRGGTMFVQALLTAENELNTKDRGAKKVIIFWTDGAPTDYTQTWSEADRIRRTGILVITIGVAIPPTLTWAIRLLDHMATVPRFFWNLPDLSVLEDLMCSLYTFLCYCGNGVIEGDEECDDGISTQLCTQFCTRTFCGDGIVQAPNGRGQVEECDGSPDCQQDCKLCQASVLPVIGNTLRAIKNGNDVYVSYKWPVEARGFNLYSSGVKGQWDNPPIGFTGSAYAFDNAVNNPPVLLFYRATGLNCANAEGD